MQYSILFFDRERERQRLDEIFQALHSASTVENEQHSIENTLSQLASYDFGESYQGQWSHDSPEGVGIMVYENRTVYIGSIVGGVREGPGMLYALDSPILTRGGIWEDDSLIISQPHMYNSTVLPI